jgi:hypothetical protein
MRSRSVTVAVSIALLSGAGAVGSYARASQLRTEAHWLLERGNAEAEEYANTFESAMVDKQFATFSERRVVLDGALLWQRFQMLFLLIGVIAAFSSYVLHLFHRLRTDLEEVTDGLEETEKGTGYFSHPQ